MFLRRAIALVSMLTLTVPVLITTLAAPAGATTTFDVPGLIADSSIGYTTNYIVNGSVTLSATGGWTENTAGCPALNCRGPNGTGAPLAGENQANWLLPNGSAFILAGRIGTSGPWTAVGSGPVTMHGNGALYMAMNDRLPSYADNGGSMHVTATDPLQLSTSYLSEGPVLAGTPVDWEGTIANTNSTNVAGGQAIVSFGAPAVAVPTWSVPASESSGTCTPSEGDEYFCNFGTVPADSTAFIDATVDTTGARPGFISDSLQVSTDGGSSYSAAPVAQQQIDGLQFSVLAPPTIPAGKVLQLTTTVTNTSATDPISDIFLHGSLDNGAYQSGPPECVVDNGGEGGPTIDCPNAEGGYTLPPGGSLDFTTTVNTGGLAGQTIGWSMFGDSPDLNGDTQTESGSVGVVAATAAAAPTVSIVSPASNVKLGQTLTHVFSANASPASGQSITYVDLKVDNGARTIDTSSPYSVTLAPNQLNPGTHVLSASAHDSDGQTKVTSITVTVAGPPSVAIVPPAGFTNLDTAKTFHSIATPGASGVTIASVTYAVDGNSIGSTTAAPYTKVVDPSILSLSSGSHSLTAIALDSLGQTATNNFNFSVPGATLTIAGTNPPVIGQITGNGDAAWPIQVNNTSNVVAHHVKLTIDATATAPNGATTALSFDLGAINGGLNLPATTVTCVPGSGTTFVCNVPDLPPMSSLSSPYRIFVTTPSLPAGSTITGNAVASAANAGPASGVLDAVSVISCGPGCVIGVAAPGDPFASTPGGPTAENPTKQVITLSSGVAGGPELPAVTVTLSSIDPTTANDDNNSPDASLCPTDTGPTACAGQISSVVGDFGSYVDKKNPIRVTIITRWGTSIPPGGILMEKDSGGDPFFLVPCVVNPTTREFNTPCVLPEIVHGTVAAGDLTTYDSVLFVGDDVHFARRIIAGVDPPGAPTGVSATAGVGKAILRWTAPTATNGGKLIGYEVTVLSGGVVQKVVDFDSTALTQTIPGLNPSKTYTFKVAAANPAGLSVVSAASNAIKPIGPPAAPTGVTATAGAGRATVRWTAPTATGGSPITGYVITVLIAGVVQKTVTLTNASVGAGITNLAAGTYTFKVVAKNVAGAGPASALSNAVRVT